MRRGRHVHPICNTHAECDGSNCGDGEKCPRCLTREDTVKQLERDLADCMNAVQTIFYRCVCGRMAEKGIKCPSVQEGGECEAGN